MKELTSKYENLTTKLYLGTNDFNSKKKKKKILISDQDFTWQENKKPIALMIIMQSISKFKSSLYNMVYDYVITNFNMVMIFF